PPPSRKAHARPPDPLAARLKQLSSSDGNVLFFTLHASAAAGERIEFPDDERALPAPFARLLFRMSSRLPEAMWPAAHEKGLHPNANTRGMVFNGDDDSVIRSLDIGTR